MSVVAQLLAARGAGVSGSDAHGGPAFDHLADLGITTHLGHEAAHVPEQSTVVVSTAIKETNPELAEARRRGQEVIHRSQALALAAQGLDFVAVAGAQGKTTPSGMPAEAATAKAGGVEVNIAVGYGGRQEIADAVRSLLREEAACGRSLEDVAQSISVDGIARHLYTKGQPDPDLVIRTSGEQRMSGFMLWQTVHTELYFCEAYWPDFRRTDFLRALRDYTQRERRLGR